MKKGQRPKLDLSKVNHDFRNETRRVTITHEENEHGMVAYVYKPDRKTTCRGITNACNFIQPIKEVEDENTKSI